MQKYRRVVLKDRYQIHAYLEAGLTITEIARRLGFHKATISRELKRNTLERDYQPNKATELALERFKTCRRLYKINTELSKIINIRLQMGWSPEQISGRLKIEGSSHKISYQSIYRFTKRTNCDQFLRMSYKRRGFGRQIKQRHSRQSRWKVPISQRPVEANNRTEIGHFERDLFFGANRRTILILSDRKSRYLSLAKTKNFKSDQIAELTKKLIKETKVEAKSITNDNGSEFFDVNSLKVPVYFCDVLKPQQRGTVENSIGLLRQYIKRKTNLDHVSNETIKALEKRLNLRPRKILDYKTPYEVFYNRTVALAV